MLRPVWPADPQEGPFPEVLQTIRHLLIRSGCFRLERELPGGICTHDICAPWQGTQWNKIEHQLFSFISMNWKAQPLVSYRVIVDLIAATTTTAGLTVRCELDESVYPKGTIVSDQEMADLNITRDPFHGEWNCSILSFPKVQHPDRADCAVFLCLRIPNDSRAAGRWRRRCHIRRGGSCRGYIGGCWRRVLLDVEAST